MIPIIKITVNDNDFTEHLENFAENLEQIEQIKNPDMDVKELRAILDRLDRFRQLFYNQEKYSTSELKELADIITHHWNIYVNNNSELEDREKEYLIRDFKIKIQKTLTPMWANGEVVYICAGYYRKYWTF